MLITNFASGELSRSLNGRVDLQQYYQGAAHINNFDVIPTGGIRRRTGFKRLTQIGGNARLIPFILDKNRSYIFELRENILNIWYEGITGFIKLQEITTSYTSLAEIREIQYAQNYDTMILVHRNHAPLQLKYSSSSFTASAITFDFYPDVQIDDDFDYVIIASSSLPVLQATTDGHYSFTYTKKTGSSTVTATKDYPLGAVPYCVKDGILYRYKDTTTGWEQMDSDEMLDSHLFSYENYYPGCIAFFNNRLFFASTNNARQKIWASMAPDTKDVRYNKFATYRKYVTVNRSVKEADLHTFTCTVTASSATLSGVTQDFTTSGLLQKDIKEYYLSGAGIPLGVKVVSCTSNTITVNQALPATAAGNNVVCTIQLWKSAESVTAEDYEYVVQENSITTEDCAVCFELASDQNDSIIFLSSNKFLSVGTESSIWSISAGLTALNVQAEMQGRYGADDLQGQAVSTATIYFAQGKRGIREFYYSSQVEAFETNNIAVMAEQMLTESPAVDFDFVTNPYNKIVVTRDDGILAVMLYDRTNGVMAWSRLSHGMGKIKSVAVTRGDMQNDIVYIVVKIGQNYYIERYDDNDGVYIDSWQKYDSQEDYSGKYDADNAIVYDRTTKVQTTLAKASTMTIGQEDEVYIGYPYKSEIVSMPVVNNDPTGKKRIVSLMVRFLDSYMPEVIIDNLPPEKFAGVAGQYSGIKKLSYPGASDRDIDFRIVTDNVEQVNILSINAITD